MAKSKTAKAKAAQAANGAAVGNAANGKKAALPALGNWGSGGKNAIITPEVLAQAIALLQGGGIAAVAQHVQKKKSEPARALEPVPWKAKLHEAAVQVHKTSEKGMIVYTTEQTANSQEFQATVSCALFSAAYPGYGSSKKAACDEAAKAAMYAEFPEFAQAAELSSYTVLDKKVKKVKVQEVGKQPVSAICNLSNGLGLLKGSIKKGDIEYVVEEVNGKSVATVTLHCMGGKKVRGAPQDGVTKEDKKKAKESAAIKAIAPYRNQIDAKSRQVTAVREEKKQQKKEEMMAIFAEKKRLKKEQQAAAA